MSFGGASLLVVKLILQDGLSPVTLASLRIGLGAAILFALLMATEKRWGVAIRDLPLFALLGLSGQAISQLAFIEGLSHTTVGNVSVLLSTSPIFTAAIVVLMRLENLRWKTMAGIVLSFGGVALVTQKDGLSFGAGGALVGDLFTLASALAWGIYLVVQMPLLRRYSLIKVMAYATVFGSLFTLPLTGQEVASQSWSNLSTPGWALLFYYVVASGLALSMLWSLAIRERSAANTNAYALLNPAYGLLLGVIFLGESMVPVQIAGTLAVLAGLALAHL